MWEPSFSPQELEYFTSLKCIVDIIPNFSATEFYFISGTYGPFKANHQITIPLWLAVLLKEQDKCKILPPFWLKEQELAKFIERQKNNPQLFNLQHDQFFEISYIFINKAPKDIESVSKLRGMLESLESIRKQKIRKIIEQYDGIIRFVNLTTFEVNKTRESMSNLETMIQRLKK